jgi:hypothetical protein
MRFDQNKSRVVNTIAIALRSLVQYYNNEGYKYIENAEIHFVQYQPLLRENLRMMYHTAGRNLRWQTRVWEVSNKKQGVLISSL